MIKPVMLTLTFLICQSIDLSGQEFNAREQHWVQRPCQVDIVVLVRAWDFNNVVLETEQVLHVPRLEVLCEQLCLVVVASHFVTALRFAILLQSYWLSLS